MNKLLNPPHWTTILAAGIITAATAAALNTANNPASIDQVVAISGMTGWTSNDATPRMFADVDGDGKPDIVAFAPDGVYVAINQGRSTPGGPVQFGPLKMWLAFYGVNVGGWTSNTSNPRLVADVDNDGKADIIGWGNDGIYISKSNGTSFSAPTKVVSFPTFPALQWHDNSRNPIFAADIDGDKLVDLVVFADDAVYMMKGSGSSFGAPLYLISDFVYNTGWATTDVYPRAVVDINGDGRADIVGFASDQVYVALSLNNNPFWYKQPWAETAASQDAENHNAAPLWRWGTEEGLEGGGTAKWPSQSTTPRMLADIDGDGLPDLVGFASDGIWVSFNLNSFPSLGNEGRFNISAPTKLTVKYGAATGFVDNDNNPRYAIDLDKDGKADLGLFGPNGVFEYTNPLVQYNPTVGARIDITPMHLTPAANAWTAYYGGNGFTTPFPKQPIPDVSAYPNRVRAIAFNDGVSPYPKVIVSLDALGITPAMHQSILSQLPSDFPRENLIINASHTHSGPVLTDNLFPAFTYQLSTFQNGYPLGSDALNQVDKYTQQLNAIIVQAINKAIDSAPRISDQPDRFSKLYYSFTQGYNFAYYRTTIHGANADLSQGDPTSLPDTTVMVLEDADGNVTATLFSYACHAITAHDNNKEIGFHGDWPEVTATRLEQMYPGSIALFVQGAAGDYNPYGGDANTIGEFLSYTVETLMSTTQFQSLNGVIKAAYQDTVLPLQNTGNSAFQATENPENLPIVAWNLHGASPLLLIATGGELVSGYALVFKQDLNAKVGGDTRHVWVAAYSNEVPGYIVSQEYLDYNNYAAYTAQGYYGHLFIANDPALQATQQTLDIFPGIPNMLASGTTESTVITNVEKVANSVMP